MFCFVTADGELVQTSDGHIYCYSNEKEARSYFGCVKNMASLYHLQPDLSTGDLVDAGDVCNPDPPPKWEPCEDQKAGLYESYPYKSMLHWRPIPQDIRPE
ncbi:MAG: hypothetical protein ACYS7Y_04155 [Planctomycetota bacterium]|jgi:hypothetical protein